MPFRTIPNTQTQYALIAFDKNGKERRDDSDGTGGLLSARILSTVQQEQPSHIFFFSHGWKGDMPAAIDQYNRWIKAMLDLTADRAAAGAAFKPLWIGLHWPSQPWGDEEFGGDSLDASETSRIAPAELVETYLDRLGLGPEARPLLQSIVQAHQDDAAATELPPETAEAYRTLAALAGHQGSGPDAPPDTEGEPFDPQKSFEAFNAAGDSFGGGGFLGGILGPLRQLSYWTMKKRARSIGESGMHSFVNALMQAAPAARFHMMGHSFGCIVISSILCGPDGRGALSRQVDSVALVQGAVSLWAFADTIPKAAGTGYFNSSLRRPAVRGPIVVTRSIHDKAVGTFYPLASAAVNAAPNFDPDEEDLPTWGAIGAFGIRGLQNIVIRDLGPETEVYNFEAGKIYNLQASNFIKKGDGASGAHSDIDGPQVAHALWQAALV